MKIDINKMNWFKFVGLSMIIMNAGNAVNGVIGGSYLFAGLSIGIGIAWICLIELRDKWKG